MRKAISVILFAGLTSVAAFAQSSKATAATNQASGAVTVAQPVASCADGILGCQQVGPNFGVVLDSRVQTLTQDISACVVSVIVGGTPGTGTCNFDLTTDLILKTTSAHTFN